MARITALNVNGKKLKVDVDSTTSLLAVLRNDLDLTGSKYGCGEGECGACTVLIDGLPTKSCIMPVGRIATQTDHHDRRSRKRRAAASRAGSIS